MPDIIYVGYRLKPAVPKESLDALAQQYLQTLEIPPSYKGKADKEGEWLAKERTKWDERLGGSPYLDTFDEVTLIAPGARNPKGKVVGRGVTYKSEGRAVGGKKPPICEAVRDFLLGEGMYPNAWNQSVIDTRSRLKVTLLMEVNEGRPKVVDAGADHFIGPEVIFMGFDPRTFLKILGLECSLPVHKCPLPPGLWYGNTDHRDIGDAVLPPTECKNLAGNWPFLAQARRVGLAGDLLADYDKLVEGWEGPGQHPEKDAKLAWAWAVQLGFEARTIIAEKQ